MFDHLTNLIFGWCWIVLGLAVGAGMGIGFRNDRWLGGYTAHPRRMVRLGHIAMVQLGVLNVLVALTGEVVYLPSAIAWCWVAGAVIMPAACFVYAWRRDGWALFVPAVACLLAAGGGTVWRMMPWSWS